MRYIIAINGERRIVDVDPPQTVLIGRSDNGLDDQVRKVWTEFAGEAIEIPYDAHAVGFHHSQLHPLLIDGSGKASYELLLAINGDGWEAASHWSEENTWYGQHGGLEPYLEKTDLQKVVLPLLGKGLELRIMPYRRAELQKTTLGSVMEIHETPVDVEFPGRWSEKRLDKPIVVQTPTHEYTIEQSRLPKRAVDHLLRLLEAGRQYHDAREDQEHRYLAERLSKTMRKRVLDYAGIYRNPT